jgi:hypothetical protein
MLKISPHRRSINIACRHHQDLSPLGGHFFSAELPALPVGRQRIALEAGS